MKFLLSCVVLTFLFVQASSPKDFEVMRAELLTIKDSTAQKDHQVLDFKARINTEAVTRFALVHKKSDDVLYVFNIVKQDDGYYYEGNNSYRKVYEGLVSARLPLSAPFRLKDLELIYYSGTQQQKLRL